MTAKGAGIANLSLHGGQVPRWLADRMTRLGAVISGAIVHHYGRDELLRRLAHPFWFQSLRTRQPSFSNLPSRVAVSSAQGHSAPRYLPVFTRGGTGLSSLNSVCPSKPQYPDPVIRVVRGREPPR